jgi:hypothetical protein
LTAGERALERFGAAAGIVGPILLAAYFAAPALAKWPYSGTSPDAIADYARGHQLLFYSGGWLQATGSLLSVLFLLIVLQASQRRDEFEGLLVIVGAAVLLAIVLVEAALLEAVPIAAAAGDRSTVATGFALSNGVFARIFPLAPAPLIFAGMGMALRGDRVLRSPFAQTALAIAALFVVAGVLAIFSTSGLILAIVMSVVEAVWILAAGIAFALRTGRAPRPISR